MNREKREKLFGVGPKGAVISLVLFVIAVGVDRAMGHPHLGHGGLTSKGVGVVLIAAGLALHFWSMATLRTWWLGDRLCTTGPFRWFRHPMYAAWITFVALGLTLILNSWVFLCWFVLLHLIWHVFVTREERMMRQRFREEYDAYAARTGRFIPRITRRR